MSGAPHSGVADALLDVRVRLSVELGRAQLPTARAVALTEGSLVDLDREPDAPVDLYVNGRPYGTGRLLLVDGEWAIRIEAIDGRRPALAMVQHASSSASGR